ncbi:MAG: ParB N-terminal domain-containing protein [Chryseolinea sp.]
MKTKQTSRKSLSELVPYEGNENIYSRRQDLRELAKSIRKHGVLEPLIINQQNIIVSGNSRYKACQMLGMIDVPVIKITTVSDKHLRELVVESNKQRVKTSQEVVREASRDAEVEEVERIFEYTQKINFDGNLLRTSKADKSCNLHSNTLKPWTDALLKIFVENFDYLPMSVRAVFYQMINHGFGNTQKIYMKVSRLLTVMRETGVIPYNYLHDGTRTNHKAWQHTNKNEFIAEQHEQYLEGYTRDLLQTQQFTPLLMIEKTTLSAVVEPVLDRYGIPVFYSKGQTSASQLNEIKNYLNAYQRPALLFIMTDFDPSGFAIHDNYINSLRKLNCEVNPVRVGVTHEQVKKYKLPPNLTVKEKDTNKKSFEKVTGSSQTWELDAIKPAIMAQILDEAITSHLDTYAYNQQVEIMNSELQEIADLKKGMQ